MHTVFASGWGRAKTVPLPPIGTVLGKDLGDRLVML